MPSGNSWHRQLLDQMTVEIPTIRKAVISEKNKLVLEEFRCFRHVVRSVYAYQLETNRVLELVEKLSLFEQNIIEEISEFINTLK